MLVRLVVAAVLGLYAPAAVDPAPAVRVTPTTTTPTWARCPQWWPLAEQVGWPPDQLPTVDRVMHCESNCQPAAYNRSGASGLMQVLRSWFPPDADPFDPATNLAVALTVWERQGWPAWSCR